MSKLIFTYGTVQSSKSAQLIQTHYNYKKQGKNPLVLVPSIDSRSDGKVVSRAFTTTVNAIKLFPTTDVRSLLLNYSYDVVMVEEVQFITQAQVEQLFDISKTIPVLCYGLRVDFKNKPFDSTSSLMALADELREAVILCSECGDKKARLNGKFVDDKLVTVGKSIEIGDTQYRPLCKYCYDKLKADD